MDIGRMLTWTAGPSPGAFSGYRNRPDANARAIRDGRYQYPAPRAHRGPLPPLAEVCDDP